MAQGFLDRPNILSLLKQKRSKGMVESMATDCLGHVGFGNSAHSA